MPPVVFYQRFKAAEKSKNFAAPKKAPLHPYLQIRMQNNQIPPKINPPIDRLEAQNYE